METEYVICKESGIVELPNGSLWVKAEPPCCRNCEYWEWYLGGLQKKNDEYRKPCLKGVKIMGNNPGNTFSCGLHKYKE